MIAMTNSLEIHSKSDITNMDSLGLPTTNAIPMRITLKRLREHAQKDSRLDSIRRERKMTLDAFVRQHREEITSYITAEVDIIVNEMMGF